MTPQQIVAVAVRLFAIWFGATSLEKLTVSIAALSRTEEHYGYVFVVIPVIQLLLVPLIWMFPLKIAKRIIPSPTDTDEPMSNGKASLIRGLVSVMGLWFVASGVRLLLSTIIYCIIEPRGASLPSFAANGYVVIDIMSTIIGAIIMINSRRVAMLCVGLRSGHGAGTED